MCKRTHFTLGLPSFASCSCKRLNFFFTSAKSTFKFDVLACPCSSGTGAPLASTPVWDRDFASSEELVTEFCRECRIVRKGLDGDLKKAMKDGKPVIIEVSCPHSPRRLGPYYPIYHILSCVHLLKLVYMGSYLQKCCFFYMRLKYVCPCLMWWFIGASFGSRYLFDERRKWRVRKRCLANEGLTCIRRHSSCH